MNTPTPNPSGEPRKPIVVIPSGFSKRDWLIVLLLTVGILGFIALAIHTTTSLPENTLVGVITGRSQTGERTSELTVSRGGVKSATVDTGYYLDVFVKKENRTYKVMVEPELWNSKKNGDTLQFLRPPSEQRY